MRKRKEERKKRMRMRGEKEEKKERKGMRKRKVLPKWNENQEI